jgi:hypothetical protein
MRRTIMVALAAWLIAGAVEAQPSVRVCEHANFRGRCVTLRHGSADLREWGISNKISSVLIERGTWRLCDGVDFQGRCEDFSRSVPSLAGTRLQDSVSSLRPVRGGGGGGGTAIVVFTDIRFRGRSWVFSDDVGDLRQLGLNDKVSSIRVLGGRWQICQDVGYRNCLTLTSDIPDLRQIGWNDRVSSIREGGGWSDSWGRGRGGFGGPGGYDRGGGYGDPGGAGRGGEGFGGSGGYGRGEGPVGSRRGLVLFSERGFSGRSFPLDGEIRDLSRAGFNDRARSIRVNGGRWEVCSEANFRGRCEVIDGDAPSLPSSLAGRVSSVRPVR